LKRERVARQQKIPLQEKILTREGQLCILHFYNPLNRDETAKRWTTCTIESVDHREAHSSQDREFESIRRESPGIRGESPEIVQALGRRPQHGALQKKGPKKYTFENGGLGHMRKENHRERA